MAWCRQATRHCLSQCWPRFMSPYGVTRPQLVKPRGYHAHEENIAAGNVLLPSIPDRVLSSPMYFPLHMQPRGEVRGLIPSVIDTNASKSQGRSISYSGSGHGLLFVKLMPKPMLNYMIVKWKLNEQWLYIVRDVKRHLKCNNFVWFQWKIQL